MPKVSIENILTYFYGQIYDLPNTRLRFIFPLVSISHFRFVLHRYSQVVINNHYDLVRGGTVCQLLLLTQNTKYWRTGFGSLVLRPNIHFYQPIGTSKVKRIPSTNHGEKKCCNSLKETAFIPCLLKYSIQWTEYLNAFFNIADIYFHTLVALKYSPLYTRYAPYFPHII